MNEKNKGEIRDGERLKVVVYDKQGLVQSSFSRIAHDHGYDLLTPDSLRSLVTIVAQKRADVVFLESGLKEADVFKLCRMIRDRELSVILQGRQLTRLEILAAVRAGVLDVLVKPLDSKKIVEKLHRAFGQEEEFPEVNQGEEFAIDFGNAKTPPEKARRVIQLAGDLLALPHAASAVIRITNDENSCIGDLVEPIQSDPAIAAAVLRRANSAIYGSSKRITDVKEAVVRFGMKETTVLALTFSVFNMFSKEEKSFGFNRTHYWAHSVSTGIASRLLASAAGSRTPSEAFLAGLLHDIGKIVLDDYLNREYRKLVRVTAQQGTRLLEEELATFEMDHTGMGQSVARKWRLSEQVIHAISHHHKTHKVFYAENLSKSSTTAFVFMANSLVKAMGLGHSGDFYVDEIPSEGWALCFGASFSVSSFCETLRKELASFLDALQIPMEQLGIAREVVSQNQTVVVEARGLGPMLGVFFESRGYEVTLGTLDELLVSPSESWIALDARGLDPEALSRIISHAGKEGRVCFLLSKEHGEDDLQNVHVVNPANDFFQLETILDRFGSN